MEGSKHLRGVALGVNEIVQRATQNHRVQSINEARRLAELLLTSDYVVGAHAFENARSVRTMASLGQLPSERGAYFSYLAFCGRP